MFVVNLLEEAGGEGTSVWVPVLVLGWFLVMTVVGSLVSRRNAAGNHLPDTQAGHSGDNPSEFDTH